MNFCISVGHSTNEVNAIRDDRDTLNGSERHVKRHKKNY
jgi:hypothetical protein